MKKISFFFFALLVGLGIGVSAVSAELTWDVDFWTDGSNPVNNYTRTGPGELGTIIDLQPCEHIWVDLYFTSNVGITAASFDLQYNASNLLATEILLGELPFGALPIPELSPGSAKYQDAAFPPGTESFDALLATIIFHCEGYGGPDNLLMENYLGYTTAGGVFQFDSVCIGAINNVPIPGAAWLLGFGLAGLLCLSRKGKRGDQEPSMSTK